MAVTCPKCSAPIPLGDVNVAEGVALCRSCNELTRLRELTEDVSPGAAADPAVPPRGCSFSSDGVETVIRASARSLKGFLGAAFMAGFWNGIVSVFVLIAIASTIQHVRGSVPAWFPAPSGGSGGLGPGMPLGMTIFLWVFLTPFILIGLAMLGAMLGFAAGRIEVRVRTDRASVFTGVGPLGWRQRFDPAAVKSVGIRTRMRKSEDSTTEHRHVAIECDRTITFGSNVPEERRAWLAAICRTVLLPDEASVRSRR